MTLFELVIYLVIAGVCGAIAKAVAGGTRGGFVVSVLLGFLGAFLGTWLGRTLQLPTLLVLTIGHHAFPVVWSILGGIVLVALAHLLVRRPRYSWRAWR
jgi:uncharacterized membrane protein YeaQ/YmgE (transglycosylase-associated protein family)